MTTKLLKPSAPHLVILDPLTRERVPVDGVIVDDRNPFWRRRLREGSMVDDSKSPPTVPVGAAPPSEAVDAGELEPISTPDQKV